MKTKRLKEIKIRVTADEYQRLKLRSTSARLAEFIRNSALAVPLPKAKHTADPLLLSSLARIGGNVNQIARRCNQNDFNSARVLVELMSINRKLAELLEVQNDN